MTKWPVCLLAAALFSLASAGNAAVPANRWLAAHVSPSAPTGGKSGPNGATIRQVIRFEASGTQVRLMVGNEAGKAPVSASDIRIALVDKDGHIRKDTVRRVTFGAGRQDTATLSAGGTLYSNPIDLPVSRGDVAVISAYYAHNSGVPTMLAKEAYRIPGRHSDDVDMPGGRPGRRRTIVEQVQVVPTTADMVAVAVGDSITAGSNSTPLAHKSYPEQLSDRFATLPGGDKWSVVNAGIGGNRVLHFGFGPSLVWRFDHDVLSVAGVKAVIVLEGVNDIGQPAAPHVTKPQPVTADQLISAYRSFIAKAHARGVRIYFGTILPYGAAKYFSNKGEAIRQRVNAWIRQNHEADGYVDFAAAMLDPGSQPPRIKPTLSGNGDPKAGGALHPNDAGYGEMADQITPATLSK